MEVIEANGTTRICNAASYKYPNNLAWASGGLIENKMIICGGIYINGDDPLNISCYSFGLKHQWQLHSKQTDKVVSSGAAIPLLNGLWITGGVNWWTNDILESTQTVLSDGTRLDGIKLPSPIYYHCGVKHNDIAILIGGT